MDAEQAQRLCLDRHIPFFSYRLPGETEVCWGAQLEGPVARFNRLGDEEGFVAVPFHAREGMSPLFIRQDTGPAVDGGKGLLARMPHAGTAAVKLPACPDRPDSWEEYRRKANRLLASLRSGEVDKAVLARNLVVECDAMASAPRWFGRLSGAYPTAFVFLVYVPGIMCWMGATPETFLQQGSGGAFTMALAGTRLRGSSGAWGEKELEEQQIVTRYIAGLLGSYGDWTLQGPFTVPAGKVEHLCTTFRRSRPLDADEVEAVRSALHPTPAVGGFPTRRAVALVEETEGRDRRYYAGYVGPVFSGCRFRWFVNLRSMELFPSAVSLYAGGGLTALSDPRMEWEETVLKSRTLLDIIRWT